MRARSDRQSNLDQERMATVVEIGRVIKHCRELEDVIPDPMFLVDRELVIRYVNRAAARLFKKDVMGMTGKYLDLFFPRSVYQTLFQRIHHVFRYGMIATIAADASFGRTELFLHTKLMPVKDLSGMITAVLSISRDVTELRPASAMQRRDDEFLLSYREMQVLNLVAEGKTNREIGERLFISPKTVDVHRTNIMKKLDVHNTAELILRSRQTGLLV